MKHLPVKLSLLISLIMSASGCSYEIESRFCPLDTIENNVILAFEFTDRDARDIFEENVNSVEVFVYDNNGYYHSRKKVDKSELNAFRGVVLTLAKGNYSVVAWSNRSELSSCSDMIEGETHIKDCFINNVATVNCDPLLFGPKPDLTKTAAEPLSITVPQSGIVHQTMRLQYAHKILNVLVQNYQDEGILGSLPVVEIENVWRGYDFRFNFIRESPLTLVQHSVPVSTPDGDMAHTRFIVTSFDLDNSIILHIKNPAGTTDYQVVLNDYIEENNIQLEQLVVIPIVIRYGNDASITIYFPTWGEQGIIPKPI